MMRMSLESVMLSMASTLALRATCKKLSVGCILTDCEGRILSAGYNGVAAGRRHCGDGYECKGPCEATHAESNAIISCHAPRTMIHTCYTTWSPCLACAKQLIQTGCVEIIYSEPSLELRDTTMFWEQQSPKGLQRSIRRWRS